MHTGFDDLMQKQQMDDLALMYTLVQSVNALDHMMEHLKTYIKKAGGAIVNDETKVQIYQPVYIYIYILSPYVSLCDHIYIVSIIIYISVFISATISMSIPISISLSIFLSISTHSSLCECKVIRYCRRIHVDPISK